MPLKSFIIGRGGKNSITPHHNFFVSIHMKMHSLHSKNISLNLSPYTTLSMIWTWLVESTSYDDNNNFNFSIDIFEENGKQALLSIKSPYSSFFRQSL